MTNDISHQGGVAMNESMRVHWRQRVKIPGDRGPERRGDDDDEMNNNLRILH